MQRRRTTLLTLSVLAVLVALSCGWVSRQLGQDRLDLALIAAILANDTERALACLQQGADPSARRPPDEGSPSLWERLQGMFRRKQPHNDGDPALLLLLDNIEYRDAKATDGNGIPLENPA